MRFGPIVVAVLIVGAGALAWTWVTASHPQNGQFAQGGNRGGGRRGGASATDVVPVTIATVVEQNVPVTREGIGTVQALNNVTVRSQVDGQLLSVDFIEGQMVKKGAVLARIDPTTFQAQYDQAVAKKAQDEATLSNARLDLARYEKLAQTNAGPKQQADQQAALVNQLVAQVQSDDAAIANARAVLAYTTIISPLDGRTGLRNVDPGNIIKAADANGIVTITQITPIAVIFTLPQRDLAPVNAALAKGTVPVQVLDTAAQGTLAEGQLQTVDNQIDVSTGTIRLKAQFPNADLQLWPGQFVSARAVVSTIPSAKVVPAAAVRQGPNGTFVYAVDADEKAVVRPVTVALQDSNQAVISTGVAAGDRVVTIGFAQLSDGKPVQITQTPGSKPAGASGQPTDAADTPAPAGSSTGDGAIPPRKRGGQGTRGEHKRDGVTGDGTASEGHRHRREHGTTEKPG